MPEWRAEILQRLSGSRLSPAAEREVVDELTQHLEDRYAELCARGVAPDAARMQTLEELEADTSLGARVRRVRKRSLEPAAHGVRTGSGLVGVFGDVRFAFRTLRRSPGFTAIALLTLALGVGANTAVFSVVNAILLRPLPYADADRLMSVYAAWDGTPEGRVSPPEYADMRERVRAFSSMGAYATASLNLTGDGQAKRLAAGFVDAGVLPTLGVVPVAGRIFSAEEDVAGAALVVMLTHELWQRDFGGSADVIGSTLTLNGSVARVIGVLPDGFRLPTEFDAAEPAELLATLRLAIPDRSERGSHFLVVVGRLAREVTQQAATAELATLAADFVREFPDEYPADMRFTAGALPLHEKVTGSLRRPLLMTLGAVALVLLIVCANVANLLLTRADARRREFAVRVALGAGRARIARQMVTESVVLAAIGGAIGVLLAFVCVRMMLALQPPGVPRLGDVSIDAYVLLFALGVSIAVGLLFGLAPLAGVLRPQLYGALRDGGRTLGDRAGAGLRRNLVIAETALAVVLLAGAVLLARSFIALNSVDPGYRTDNVLTFRLSPSYPEEERVIGFYDELTARLAALPGAERVGAVSNLPLNNPLGDLNFEIEGRPVPESAVSPRADWQVVTPGYFDVMGMQLVRGRVLDERDVLGAPGAVVINEAVAERYFSGQDPIGQRFTLGGGAGPGVVTIVGIVRNVRHASLAVPPNTEMYIPHAQFRFWNGGSIVRALTVVVRTDGEPARLASAVRTTVAQIDPDVPMSGMRTMDEVVATSVASQRFLMSLLLAFAGVALALSAIGTYGVLAYGVARRANEMGVRMALGARPSSVARMVIGDGMKITAIGIVLGLLGAFAVTRVLESMLYGVQPNDPLTMVAVTAVLAAVALTACAVPALKATRIDPLTALRQE